jgi:hypothetical protein
MQTKSATPTTWSFPNEALIVIDLVLPKKIDKVRRAMRPDSGQ